MKNPNAKTLKNSPPCPACEGKGKLCIECHQPLDACGCPGADNPEDCMHCQGSGHVS